MSPEFIQFSIGALLLLHTGVECWLNFLNSAHVRAKSGSIPEELRDTVDAATHAKSVDYSVARLRADSLEQIWDLLVSGVFLFSGLLPFTLRLLTGRWNDSPMILTIWLILIGFLVSIPSIPLEWWRTFKLEARFGFNTTTMGVWLADRIKGAVLGIALGFPLLWLILKLVGWVGDYWWAWAWVVIMAFQLIMVALAPRFILPLFNKLTPLPEGALRDRLLALGTTTGFSAQTILVMDGSKRSRHSNAFFTGFGRFRKIVLYDTLVNQLTTEELEAVLAHEIGHYKKGHIVKMLIAGAASTLVGLAVIGFLARSTVFLQAFGFPALQSVAPALLIVTMVSGAATFWLSPFSHWWSRRFEYEADAFAKTIVGSAAPLVGALKKLSEKNLANPTPHPTYSFFHYSHPTLAERLAALRA
ncbi:MAG TPA: M48 family metallopeptidase [Candidatus Limnocylindria bacterium]|jgi:STE24 endopeptidase|nr:M48 family metallopeptidase [Candidatus Limnocylindria bacterium]